MKIEQVSDEPPHRIERVVASQRWSDALFVHWRVDAARVGPLLPAGTAPDEFDGSSWVGLIAFRLSEARLGPIGPLPRISDFVEVNVRLYAVDARGRRGVVFRSLEAHSLLAVLGARAAFSLPYWWARTAGGVVGDRARFESARRFGGPRSAVDAVIDRGVEIADDPLTSFLTARWALFGTRRGRTTRLVNSHERWPLHPAAVTRLDDELVAAAGLPGIADRPADSVLFSPGVGARFARG